MAYLLSLSSLLGCNDLEWLALSGTDQFRNQRAEIWWFELFQPAGPIFCRIAPRVGVRAHECAHGLAIAKIDPSHSDDFVDNRRQFASGFSALDLRLPGRDVEVVDVLLQHRHEHDRALARVL